MQYSVYNPKKVQKDAAASMICSIINATAPLFMCIQKNGEIYSLNFWKSIIVKDTLAW